MIKPEQIPDEVVEAAAKAEYEVWRHDCAGELELDLEMYRLWDQLEPDEQERWCGQSRAAIAAALNAWPGVKLENLCSWVMDGPDLPYVEETASIILPLPQQARDE